MKLWDAFLEDYGNEIHDWSPRLMLELFWEFCQDGNKSVTEQLNKANATGKRAQCKYYGKHRNKPFCKYRDEYVKRFAADYKTLERTGDLMKDLRINNYTTLCAPDSEGDVQICLIITDSSVHREYVSFEVLKKWVASIEEPSNTRMHVETKPCGDCKAYENVVNHNFCASCGRALHQ